MPERIAEISNEGRLGQSDHSMILLKISGDKVREVVKEVRNWRRADWDGMRTMLGKENWERNLRDKNVTQMWTTVKKKILDAVKKKVPMRKVKQGGRAAWMTRELMAAVRKKKRMWEEAKETGRREEYKEYDKKVRGMIRRAKSKFEKKLADGGNSRPFYSYIKKRNKGRPAVGPLKDSNQRTVTEDGEMAEVLNEFFSSVFTREEGPEIIGPTGEPPPPPPPPMGRPWITEAAATT